MVMVGLAEAQCVAGAAPQAIIAHVVHLVNRDYAAMCQDYYALQFMDRSVDTSPIAPALATFFNDVLDRSVQELNFKARPCGRAPARPAPLLACAWNVRGPGPQLCFQGQFECSPLPQRCCCPGSMCGGGCARRHGRPGRQYSGSVAHAASL